MVKTVILSLVLLVAVHTRVGAQELPVQIERYLDRNFRGWKLVGECYEKDSDNERVLVGDFDGNRKNDYAVKFVRGEKGFLMAFLAEGSKFRPFFLHIYTKDDARFSDLTLLEKGECIPKERRYCDLIHQPISAANPTLAVCILFGEADSLRTRFSS